MISERGLRRWGRATTSANISVTSSSAPWGREVRGRDRWGIRVRAYREGVMGGWGVHEECMGVGVHDGRGPRGT